MIPKLLIIQIVVFLKKEKDKLKKNQESVLILLALTTVDFH